MTKRPKMKAWSYSRYQCYSGCAFQAHCKYNEKLPEPEVPAMQRGTAIHKMCEDFLNDGGRVKKDIKLFSNELKELRRSNAVAEAEWAFTKTWQPTAWFDPWGAKKPVVWMRAKIDALVDAENSEDGVMRIIDFKTGKVRDNYMEQLELYAVSGFAQRKKVKKIKTELWYLDHGVVHEEEFDRKHFPALKQLWNDRTRPMMNDVVYAPKPSFKCRWCSFSKDKGGPCKFRGD